MQGDERIDEARARAVWRRAAEQPPGYRVMSRWGLRRTSAALEQLLEAVDVNARTRGAFAPPRPLPGAGAAGVLSPPSG